MPPAATVLILFIFLALVLIIAFMVVQLGRDEDPPAAQRRGRPRPKRYLNVFYPPPRIELLRCEEIPWNNSAEVNARAQRLQAMGFQDAGRYQNSELLDAYGWAFVHPEARVTVVFMTFAGKIDYFEMATHYADGTSFAFSNGDLAGVLATAPHLTLQRVDEADPALVYGRLLRERPDRPFDPDHVDDFAVRYQDRWARRMDWLNARGGYTEDEIRAICAARGLDATDEMIADCRDRVLSLAMLNIEAVVREQFFASVQLGAAEADSLWLWTVLIHDQLEFDMIVPIFEPRWKLVFQQPLPEPCPLAEEIRNLGKPCRESFALLNEQMPGPRFPLVGQFTTPIDADLYVVDGTKLPPGLER